MQVNSVDKSTDNQGVQPRVPCQIAAHSQAVLYNFESFSGDSQSPVEGGLAQAFLHFCRTRNALYLGVRYIDIYGEIVREEKFIRKLVRTLSSKSQQ